MPRSGRRTGRGTNHGTSAGQRGTKRRSEKRDLIDSTTYRHAGAGHMSSLRTGQIAGQRRDTAASVALKRVKSTGYKAGQLSRSHGTSTGQNPLSPYKGEGDVPVSRRVEEKRSDFITFAGGLTIRTDVVAWVIDQDLAGVSFAVRDGRIYPEPLAALSDADKAFLRAHRDHVLALITYQPPRPAWEAA